VIELVLIAYAAETCSEVDTAEGVDFVDDLLIELAVSACVERLKRAEWVALTSRISILITGLSAQLLRMIKAKF
jgi:hypothetical protein